MKKVLITIFLIICQLISASIPTYATSINVPEFDESTSITYLEDGSYIVTTITSEPNLTRATTFTKTGNKVVSYYDGDDTLLWQYTLFGEFLVESGVSAVCTSATYTQTIYANRWSFSNGQATASGATAYGVGTFKKKVLFVTTSTVDIDISFTCDVYGNLSSN
jgi:hypothetical protein